MEQTSKILVFLLVVFTFVAIRSTSANPAPRGSVPLRCMVREYTAYQAEKPGCRPQPLLVDACYGLCDTFQVPALRPPFKHSQHKMCSYGDTVEVTIELDDCDEGVDRTFTYLNARNCVCRKCSPENTFCLGIH
ncbi:putative glycoprotein hormone-beta5 [Apostichopus japonicus]|uniref:Putative glycoprotein hormone-beta5 n=1 Tax=Stichopus japonicus TaxID=307972 RepID=A0A2G8LCX8_STIJA|nr:putative glycoprotein hormone-beta5 [Apostichopus japonicus]